MHVYTDGNQVYRSKFGYAFREANDWLKAVMNRNNVDSPELGLIFNLPAYPVIFAMKYNVAKRKLKRVELSPDKLLEL